MKKCLLKGWRIFYIRTQLQLHAKKHHLMVGTAIFFSLFVNAQSGAIDISRLTLNQAVTRAKESNKTIEIFQTEEQAAESDYRDAKNGRLPNVSANSFYLRFSDITLYENGLTSSNTITKRPDANVGNLGIDASFNLYSGGKQRSLIEEAQYKKDLSAINTREQSGTIGLQTAAQYLDLVKLYHFRKLINEQHKRAEVRLKNITALYNSQQITKNDLLRAEVALSNIMLSQEQNDNDIKISSQKMSLLLNIPKNPSIIPADSTMTIDEKKTVLFENNQNPYPLQKLDMSLKIQSAKIKNLKANYLPTIQLVSAYGFNYPNSLFSVPVAQTYAVGFAGARLYYNIASLYQNKNKVKAINLRDTELKQQKSWVADNIEQEISALQIKYNEALNRITVNNQSITQAKANLEITNNKYLNQLALLTDVLEADNLYQETRYNYVAAQTNALLIYYKILFTKGIL